MLIDNAILGHKLLQCTLESMYDNKSKHSRSTDNYAPFHYTFSIIDRNIKTRTQAESKLVHNANSSIVDN